jgi:hypothetical protein
MTYIVQRGRADDPQRVFIDAILHAGCTEITTIEAASWKDAREKYQWLG